MAKEHICKLPSSQRCKQEYSIIILQADLLKAQGSHRLEKCLNLKGFLEKSLKIIHALKSTGKSLKGLENSLNSSFFCRT